MNLNFINQILSTDSLINYVLFIVVLLFIYKILKFIISKLTSKLQEISTKTETKIDDIIVNTLKEIKNIEYFIISFYFSLKFIKTVNYKILLIFKILFLSVIIYRTIFLIDKLISLLFEKVTESSKESEKSINVLKNIIKTVIWIFAVLFFLHNLGININSILAGLGIGGVAIALASQTILKDIFNFFVIIFDKPFKIGDFVTIPSLSITGTIEDIGLKSTKIRTLQGEMVIIANSKISEEIIHNFSKMKERRISIKIGITYNTPLDKIKHINSIIEKAVKLQSNTRFERANLIQFSNSSMEFELIYYINSPDYLEYIKTNEEILISIAKEFKKEGIEFAYPTQTIYLKKEDK
ncbi:MAG: mechanosensitive ion channel family protein [Elusimicrobiales bacterium]|nr:mechanosensitive ion channel family protein [Elusimicrobiales bacterium]